MPEHSLRDPLPVNAKDYLVGGAPLSYVYMKLRRGGSGSSHVVRIVEVDSVWRTVRVLCPSLRDASV
jgi:hypothetical protein